MKSTEFCYWLQGYFELSPEGQSLTAQQVEIIKRHLALVFRHEIDLTYGPHLQELQDIHDGNTPSNNFRREPRMKC